MAYRDDVTALAARHTALSQELAEKQREVSDARNLLEQARARARLPVLDNLRVASPCTADWNKMTGDDRARHCGDCKKDVFNISGMTRDEAEALLIERAGKLCVRYYQRGDGTILFADCAIGVKRRRRRRLVAAGAALLASGAGVAGYEATRVTPEYATREPGWFSLGEPMELPLPPSPPRKHEAVMGAMAIPDRVTPEASAPAPATAHKPPPAPPTHLTRGQLHLDP